MKNLNFNAKEILTLLPHKYPFILLDQAYDIEPGIKGYGIKNISLNEWFFQGHFPSEPIVPGVLITEALAQLTAVVTISQAMNIKHKEVKAEKGPPPFMGYLAKTDIKFIKPVVPGEQIVLFCEQIKNFSNLSQWKVSAKVGKKEVTTGFMHMAQIK